MFISGLRQSGPLPPVIGPLHRYVIDDQDPGMGRTGAWYTYDEASLGAWPGGLTNGRMTYASIVWPSHGPTVLTFPVMQFAGTAEEGVNFCGASEDAGPAVLQMKALDHPTNTGWNDLFTIDSAAIVRTWMASEPAENVLIPSSYTVSYPGYTQTAYFDLTRIIHAVRGLPAGRYQFRLVKLVNTPEGQNNSGNKATYFDSTQVDTCII